MTTEKPDVEEILKALQAEKVGAVLVTNDHVLYRKTDNRWYSSNSSSFVDGGVAIYLKTTDSPWCVY